MSQRKIIRYEDLVRRRNELVALIQAVEIATAKEALEESSGYALDELINEWDKLRRLLTNLNQRIKWLGAH